MTNISIAPWFLAAALASPVPAWAAYKPVGPVLIQEITASNQATVDFTEGIDSTFKVYLIEYYAAKPASDDVTLRMRVSTDGGGTWKSGASDYAFAATVADAYQNVFWSTAAARGTIHITPGGDDGQTDWGIGNAAHEDASGVIRIYDPANGGQQTAFRFDGTHSCAGGAPEDVCDSRGVARYLSNTAVNGFRLYFGTGNISSGVFRLYGIR